MLPSTQTTAGHILPQYCFVFTPTNPLQKPEVLFAALSVPGEASLPSMARALWGTALILSASKAHK